MSRNLWNTTLLNKLGVISSDRTASLETTHTIEIYYSAPSKVPVNMFPASIGDQAVTWSKVHGTIYHSTRTQ